ncbi:hypothetical protein GF407_02215 [candidate division KSB1 bacterium]|nr:hypothetical protein [candidate division KSB1 bacterium]
MGKINIDPRWHKAQVEAYKEVQPVYETYAEILYKILSAAGDLYAPLCVVQSRAKSIPSFAEKAIRKAYKYKEPLKQLTDLCGARIITHFQYQADRICRFIKDHFEIDEANSLDVSSRLRVSEFGYLSVHYIVTPRADSIFGVDVPAEIKTKKAEIQVRTYLQHTWADIVHDRIYKTPIQVPVKWKRQVYSLAAMLETADKTFADISESLDYYIHNYGTMMSEADLKQEIEFVRTILDNEIESNNRPKHALRLAGLYKSMADYENVIKTLEPFKETKADCVDEIKVQYGHAVCQFNRETPESDVYKEGQNVMENVARSGETLVLDQAYTDASIMDPDMLKRRAEAFYLLGRSYGRIAAAKGTARTLFFQAYQIDPSNPYYFAAFAEFEIYCRSDRNMITLLTPSIYKTIKTCREHIHMGIEQARAYMTIARLYLMLEQVDKSLAAYANAVDLCISGRTCIPPILFDEEIKALMRLRSAHSKNAEHFSWIEKFILLAKVIAYGDKDAKKQLKKQMLRKEPFDNPVVIVAGGAEGMPKTRIADYQEILIHSLQNFKGTIIAGGTTSGIPGLVSLATQAARRNNNGDFALIGYLPKSLPGDATADEHYDQLVTTGGITFSPEELIQYWIDLIMNDIRPADVLMLGINGGRISDLEYRLALALGARVGVVESSGRAATDLLLDEDWVEHPRLLVIPHDPLSVWAFVNQNHPSTLTPKQIDAAAKKVHEYYLNRKIEEKRTTDPTMLPYEKLDDDLKRSNQNQVAFMQNVLHEVGLGIRPSKTSVQYELDRDTLLRMATMEHARWVIERLRAGWKYGPRKNIEEKISPYLVAWEALTPEVQQWDVNAVEKFPVILADAGYEIYEL